MIRLILALFLATADASPIIVTADYGGSIAARGAHIAWIGDRPVRIEGTCQSACVMYLGADNVCVTDGARFMVHGPSWMGIPMDRPSFDLASRYIAAHLPSGMARWFMQTGRWGTYTIDGAGVIANGWGKRCDG